MKSGSLEKRPGPFRPLVIPCTVLTLTAKMRATEPFGRITVLMLVFSALLAVADEKKTAGETPDLIGLAERAQKSVVVITQYGRNGKQDGMGAGFVLSVDGLI